MRSVTPQDLFAIVFLTRTQRDCPMTVL